MKHQYQFRTGSIPNPKAQPDRPPEHLRKYLQPDSRQSDKFATFLKTYKRSTHSPKDINLAAHLEFSNSLSRHK